MPSELTCLDIKGILQLCHATKSQMLNKHPPILIFSNGQKCDSITIRCTFLCIIEIP